MQNSPFNLMIWGVPDWCQREDPNGTQVASVTVGSEQSPLLGTNLLNSDIGKVWRSDDISAVSAAISSQSDSVINVDLGISRVVSSAGLVNHNGDAEATWRVRFDGAAIAANGAVIPNSTATEAGAPVGLHTAIDEGVDTANLGDSVSMAVGDSIRFGFAAPGGTLASGADLQLFRLVLKDAGATETSPSTFTVKLKEAIGTELATLGTFTINPPSGISGQVWDIPWDASLLTDSTGVDAECSISFDSGGSAMNIYTLEWRAELTTPAMDYDSGWNDMLVNPIAFGQVPITDLGGRDVINTATHLLVDGSGDQTTTTSRYMRIEVRNPRNADQYFQAGQVVAGLTTASGLPLQENFLIEAVDLTKSDVSIGGTLWTDEGAVYRRASLPLRVPFAEGLADWFEAVIRRLGRAKPFGVAILPGINAAAGNENILSFFGKLASDVPMRNANAGDLEWAFTMEVREII